MDRYRSQPMTTRLLVARVISMAGLGNGYVFLLFGVAAKAGWAVPVAEVALFGAVGLIVVVSPAMGLSYALTRSVW